VRAAGFRHFSRSDRPGLFWTLADYAIVAQGASHELSAGETPRAIPPAS